MTDNSNYPDVPDTVAGLIGDTPEGFDPRTLPGAEVIMDDGDVSVVAVPLSAFDGPPPAGDMTLEAAMASLAGSVGKLKGTGFLGEALSAITTNFRQMGWAVEELEKAHARHGIIPSDKDAGDPEDDVLTDGFRFVACVEQPYMAPEEIFRAHCAEIFDRLATGKPVQPGTDAEILGLLCEQSLVHPFCPGLETLYYRLAKRVVPDTYEESLKAWLAADPTFSLEAYEAVNHEDADRHEAELRELLTRDRRPLGDEEDPDRT